MIAHEAQTAAHVRTVCAAHQSTKASQRDYCDLPELMLQLQRAHEDPEKSTAKLQSSADYAEEAEQEQPEKVSAL